MKPKRLFLGISLLLTAWSIPAATASLTTAFQFNGTGNWSLDGVGTSTTGSIDAIVPAGSTVVKAFLYSSMYTSSVVPSVNFDGTTVSGANWTALGVTGTGVDLQAYRADVTAQVMAKIGGGNAVPFSFSIGSEVPNSTIDGEVLAIIYSNPAESVRTIAFLDGFSATTGDSTSVNLASPITAGNLADPNFEAQMSLGIGYGFQGTEQASTVDVNGSRLTSSAGGQDDGAGANGSLLTVGGIGDSLTNPANPLAGPNGDPRYDDELYSLKPFLSAGNSLISIRTLNPSNDDNIFFAGINITAQANVTTAVPDGGTTIAMLGLSLTGMAGIRRKLLASKKR